MSKKLGWLDRLILKIAVAKWSPETMYAPAKARGLAEAFDAINRFVPASVGTSQSAVDEEPR